MLISTTTHLSLPEEAPVNLFQDIKQKKRNTHTHKKKGSMSAVLYRQRQEHTGTSHSCLAQPKVSNSSHLK